MEIKVHGTVQVELGPQTLALLTGGMSAPAKQSKEAVAVLGEGTAKPEEEKKPAAPKAPAKPKKDEPTPFEDLSDEAKLEEIKSLVTKATKKGKSADVKFMLSNFEAGRASELSPEQYDDFHNAMQRYHAGKDVTDIFVADNLD